MALWRWLPALLLLSCGSESVEEVPRNQCFVVVHSSGNYHPNDFFDHVVGWTNAGTPRMVRGSTIELLMEEVSFAIDENLAAMTINCRCALLALAIANLLLRPEAEAPWDLLVSTPWEDLARSKWPIFELLTAWWEAQPGAADMPAVADPDEGKPFWRTCRNRVWLDLWQDPGIQSTGAAMRAAAPRATTGPLARALSGAAAAALLQRFDHVAWGDLDEGLCGNLHWGLLAQALAMAQQPRWLVEPGYGLRLLQASFQVAHSVSPAFFMEDVMAAPWPVLPILGQLVEAERSHKPSIDTRLLNSSSKSFAPVAASWRAALLDTLRVAHGFCDALGVAYVAICGTLLGVVRHMGPIPWDDDVDLCVDALHEPKFFSVLIAEEAKRMRLDLAQSPSWRTRRAVRYLEQEGYVLQAIASRSLTFRILRAGADGSGEEGTPHVDIWMCWDLAHPEHQKTLTAEESASGLSGVVLMSRFHGPAIPKSDFSPRRKVPFGNLALWAPHDPAAVTRRYLASAGYSEDFLSVCEGQKVHGDEGNAEYSDSVSCQSLGTFASPWRPVPPGPDLNELHELLAAALARRLPGLPAAEGAVAESASVPGQHARYRWRARVGVLHCEALLWRDEEDQEDWLAPGRGPGGLALRSLLCREGEEGEPVLEWERDLLF